MIRDFDQSVIEEAEAGILQTIMIFQQVGLSNEKIAQMLRAAADTLDPKIIIQEPGHA